MVWARPGWKSGDQLRWASSDQVWVELAVGKWGGEKNEPLGNAPSGSSAQASDGIPLTPSGLPCRKRVMHGACQSREEGKRTR